MSSLGIPPSALSISMTSPAYATYVSEAGFAKGSVFIVERMAVFAVCLGRLLGSPKLSWVYSWHCQRDFQTDSSQQSHFQRIGFESYAPCPSSKGHGFSVKCQQSSVSFIGRLFGATGPFAILWRVGSIVIDALKGIASWSRPHIINEIMETLLPSFADHNASAAVVFPRRIRFATATTNHASPDVVERVIELNAEVLSSRKSFLWNTPNHVAGGVSNIGVYDAKNVSVGPNTNITQESVKPKPFLGKWQAAPLCAALEMRPRRIQRMRVFYWHGYAP